MAARNSSYMQQEFKTLDAVDEFIRKMCSAEQNVLPEFSLDDKLHYLNHIIIRMDDNTKNAQQIKIKFNQASEACMKDYQKLNEKENALRKNIERSRKGYIEMEEKRKNNDETLESLLKKKNILSEIKTAQEKRIDRLNQLSQYINDDDKGIQCL